MTQVWNTKKVCEESLRLEAFAAMYALAVEIQTVIGKEKLAFIGRQRASTVNSDIAAFAHCNSCFCKGEAGYCDPDHASWHYEENFDLSCLADQNNWIDWFKQEQQWAKNDGRSGYGDMLDREIIEEIVVLVRDGQGYVWDGNHRVGAAFTRGLKTLKAIIGVPLSKLVNTSS
jgi:hypothetical protein